MKDEVFNQIAGWVNSLAALAADELPSFVVEAATFGFYKSVFLAIVCFIACAFFCMLYIRRLKCSENCKNSDDCVIGSIWFCVIACVFLILGAMATATCIKAKVAPRLYVLERFLDK